MPRTFVVTKRAVGNPSYGIYTGHIQRTNEAGKNLCELQLRDDDDRTLDALYAEWKKTGKLYEEGDQAVADAKPLPMIIEYSIGEPPRDAPKTPVVVTMATSGRVKKVWFKSTYLCAYVMETPGDARHGREFVMLLNGSPIPIGYEYIDSCVYPLGGGIFHIFEKMLP